MPVCPFTGIGSAVNQVYREDGYRKEEHPFEDRVFRFRHDSNTSLYAVLDGDGGTRAADFALQRFPAELLLGQLDGRTDDREVKDVLLQAFMFVEKGFFEAIDMLLLDKATMQLQLQGVCAYEVLTKYPKMVNKLEQVNAEVATGVCAVVALLRDNRLYVANVGTCRALLVKSREGRGLEVVQLSVEHSLANEDEFLRLVSLGLSPSKLRGAAEGKRPLPYTRCIGNYSLKGGYKESTLLGEAREEPVIAEPEICGGIPVDDGYLFLMLMSEGLHRSLREAGFEYNTNEELAQMALQEFGRQTTLDGVARGVVDRVVRLHRETYTSGADASDVCRRRRDITLLIRNFNQPLLAATPPRQRAKSLSASPSETLSGTFSSRSSAEEAPRTLFKAVRKTVPVDQDGRIEPYVDFADFFLRAAEARKDGTWPAELEF